MPQTRSYSLYQLLIQVNNFPPPPSLIFHDSSKMHGTLLLLFPLLMSYYVGMVNCYRSPIVDQSSSTNNLCAVIDQPFSLESFADVG